MIPFISSLEMFLLRFFKDEKEKGIDEPKYLNEAILEFPATVISSLLKESKYLYKKAIFEIVAHGLNIHRDDIKSNDKIKNILLKSTRNLQVDIENLYYKKVKTIYGEILKICVNSSKIIKPY